VSKTDVFASHFLRKVGEAIEVLLERSARPLQLILVPELEEIEERRADVAFPDHACPRVGWQETSVFAMRSPGTDPDDDAPGATTRHLVARLRSGGDGEFRELYERIAPSLWAWTRVRVGSGRRSALEPEDLLQEVWLRAIEALPRFDPEGPSFRAWIFGIAKNVAFEIRRRRTANSMAFASESNSAVLQSWPDVVTSIRSRLSKDESVQLLLDHLATLEPVDRKLLIHCGFEDVPCNQAAVRLGLSPEAATKRWQRLRGRLREGPLAELLEVGRDG
jgi:RNA polymerase sigma-70 factor (ECF subfamily)